MDKAGGTQQKLRFSGLKVVQQVYLFTFPRARRNTGNRHSEMIWMRVQRYEETAPPWQNYLQFISR